VIEVELSRSSLDKMRINAALDKMRIYAALGVGELWRFDGETLIVYELAADGQYQACAGSPQLADFPVKAVPG
jgi:hypothetical protein